VSRGVGRVSLLENRIADFERRNRGLRPLGLVAGAMDVLPSFFVAACAVGFVTFMALVLR
jgi:hypothetical protein